MASVPKVEEQACENAAFGAVTIEKWKPGRPSAEKFENICQADQTYLHFEY